MPAAALRAVRCLPVSLRSVYYPLALFRDVGVNIELDVDAMRDCGSCGWKNG